MLSTNFIICFPLNRFSLSITRESPVVCAFVFYPLCSSSLRKKKKKKNLISSFKLSESLSWKPLSVINSCTQGQGCAIYCYLPLYCEILNFFFFLSERESVTNDLWLRLHSEILLASFSSCALVFLSEILMYQSEECDKVVRKIFHLKISW